MDPITAAAVIQGGTQLVSGAIGGKGSGKAAKAQKQATDQALAYQREQDAKAEARQREIDAKEEARWNAEQAKLDRQEAEYEARMAPYRALRGSLAAQQGDRLGLNIGSLAGMSGRSGGQRPAPGQMSSSGRGGTIAELAGYQPPPTVSQGAIAPPVEGITIADLMNGTWGAKPAEMRRMV